MYTMKIENDKVMYINENYIYTDTSSDASERLKKEELYNRNITFFIALYIKDPKKCTRYFSNVKKD